MATMDVYYATVLFCAFFGVAAGKDCVFRYPCSCSTDEYKIDLEPMMKKDGSPLYQQLIGGGTFYLDPCGTALSVQDCSSINPAPAGCQINSGIPYGIASTTGYTGAGDPAQDNVIFTYSYGSGTDLRTTNLQLACSTDERTFSFTSEAPKQTYNFLLKSKYACKVAPSPPDSSGGLSAGSVLVIVFFVVLVVYIVAGILIMKFHKKAEGVEVIPNVEFWRTLPLLIKEGFVFTFSKCKGTGSPYNQV